MAIEIPRAGASGAASAASATAGPPRDLFASFGLKPRPPSAADRMFFTERLALLLETGVPLHSSLEALKRQVATPAMAPVIADLLERVSGGATFAQALQRHPDAFPRTYVNLVAAGETGGFLPAVLQRLKEMDERREELRRTLTSALSYPAFLVFFSVSVVVFVLLVVFPKFSELFLKIQDQLPVTTVVLMAASDWIRQWGVHALVALGALGALLWRSVRSGRGADLMDATLLRLPLVRDVTVQLRLVQFLFVMSLSLSNGVALLDALRSCREVVRGASFRRFVEALERSVSEGRGIAAGFREAPFLPPLVPQMIATGEETGNLALVMGRVADFYQREWSRKLTALSKLVEPLMLLVMGVVVGLIVSSLILPIFKLSRAVH